MFLKQCVGAEEFSLDVKTKAIIYGYKKNETMNEEKNKREPGEHQRKTDEKEKVEENQYTEGEQKFADGEGTKLDEAIDKQEENG